MSTPVPRTQAEIVAFMKAHEVLLDFTCEVLLDYLDYEHARQWLKSDTTAEQWATVTRDLPATVERATREAHDYMRDYGWPKCQNHRGISAGRSVQKQRAWMFLLGHDDLVAFSEDEDNYPQYGAPILAQICTKMGWSIPDDPETQRMIAGNPCEPDCDMGCGT